MLLAHEIWSVHEYFKDLCRRLAQAGLSRGGAGSLRRARAIVTKLERDDIFTKVVSRVPDAQVMADLDAAAAWAARNGGDVESPRRATGFCWGGRITWLYAAHSSRS